MKRHTALHIAFLCLLLLYGLLVSVLTLDYNSVFIDEAYHIQMGYQLMRGDPCPGCAYATGSVTIHPVLAALGDSVGELHGARIVNVLLGLALTVVIFLTARLLFDSRFGLLAAALFMFSGQVLYRMKLATYDMTAAFFLGLAFLLMITAEKADTEFHRVLALVETTIVLCIACITKYLIPVFAPVFIIYILIRHGLARTVIYCIIPIFALIFLYLEYMPYSVTTVVLGQIEDVRRLSTVPLRSLTSWTFRWVALSYLLAIFGIFHERYGKRALVLILFSLPIIVVHLVTRAEQGVNKNVLFAIVFLAPAAALGVDHIAHLFSMRNAHRAVKAFFTAAVLVVYWSYGVYNLRWLEKQYPDVSPVIDFFDDNGFDGMRVALNGWDGVIYTYTLGAKYPHSRFDHISEITAPDGQWRPWNRPPDFIVCEDLFYGKHYPCGEFEDYMNDDYVLLEDFAIEHSWGTSDAKIYGRK